MTAALGKLYGKDKSEEEMNNKKYNNRSLYFCCSFYEELFVILFKGIKKLTVFHFWWYIIPFLGFHKL